MKKYLCAFGTPDYEKSLTLLEKTAYEIGKVDKVSIYTREWLIKQDFYKYGKSIRYILDQKKGGGLWLWKIFIIQEEFKKLNDGDVVLYSDGGLRVTEDLNPLYELCDQNTSNSGKIFFKLPAVGVPHHLAKAWVKRDCFVLMNCDTEEYWNAPMVNGALSLWKKNKDNEEFLEEWKKYAKNPLAITDDPNMMGKPNFMEFRGHRHDQSILSLLCKRHGFELFRDPTQYGDEELNQFANSPYSRKFWHHRNFKHNENN